MKKGLACGIITLLFVLSISPIVTGYHELLVVNKGENNLILKNVDVTCRNYWICPSFKPYMQQLLEGKKSNLDDVDDKYNIDNFISYNNDLIDTSSINIPKSLRQDISDIFSRFIKRNVFYVGGSGPNNYTSIQDAINDASNDDTIIVYSGQYFERVMVDKSLHLYGVDTGDGIPYVCANNTGSVFSVEEDNCIIDGFSANDAGDNPSYERAGFVLYSRNCIIKNCISQGNSFTGIYLGANGITNNVKLINNTIRGAAVGIYMPPSPIGGSENILIMGNNIISNGEGMELNQGIDFLISKNNIISNKRGVRIWFGGKHIITDNNISESDSYGLLIEYSDHIVTNNTINYNGKQGIVVNGAYRNEIINNNISNNGDSGVTLWYASDNILEDNIVKYNGNIGIWANCEDGGEAHRNHICNNTFYGGLALYFSDYNIVYGNNFSNGGLMLISSTENTVENNIVNGRDLVYLKDQSNCKVISAGQIILIDCESIIIQGQNLSYASIGIQLFNSNNCNIYKNYIVDNIYGILIMDSSSDTQIQNNHIFDNNEGILIVKSKSNRIFNNNIFLNKINDARFLRSLFNKWNNNFWGSARSLPYPIYGKLGSLEIIPWINIDWNPASEPYDIEL